MSEQRRQDEQAEERPFSRLAGDLQPRRTGGPDDYVLSADGPVQYVVVANMEGILGAMFASDAEGAVCYLVREEQGPEASNCTGLWRDLRRSAKQRGLAPTEALAEMAQHGGYPFPGRALPGPWQEAPSLASLREEIVGDGKWHREPRDLKIHVYPVIPLRGPKMLAPQVTEEMRLSAWRQPGRVIFAIDPAYTNPHGEVPDHGKLGGWPIDENGEIGEFHLNPDYEPTLTALRWRAPENDVERTLQAFRARRGTAEAFLDALRAGTVLVSVEADGRLRFRDGDDGERHLDVYTSAHYVPDDGRQVRAMNAGELAKVLYGCYVAVNTGSSPNLRFPSADLAVSAFG
ncbi:type VII secretion system-associated protein [Streptomyces sviceus]|uniref:type VII secretion system-associated protein n=1 Tax=Streptomyces sviceus TaxID=285530 RepID=UPI0037F61B13